MEAFHKLPAELQKSLQRWYLISSIAFIVILMGMAGAHIITSMHLHKIGQCASEQCVMPQQVAATSGVEHAVIQKRIDELDALLQKKQIFLPLLVACIEALPLDEIRLQQFIITTQKTFTCSGETHDAHLVTEFVHALHALGLACTTVTLKTDPTKELPIDFYIEAKNCYKG